MLKEFAKRAPHREKEARAVLRTIPGVGAVTIEVVLGELGDITWFRNAKAVCASAGLAPSVRHSGGTKAKDLAISKEGSGLLRWVLVEVSWRAVRISPKWRRAFERISKRAGGKRAIVAVARKPLCVIYAMLRTMTPYRILTT
jgi:transposase